MALRKRQLRQRKVMTAKNRRNLELMHESYLNTVIMCASIATASAVAGGISFWGFAFGQKSYSEGALVLLLFIALDVFLCYEMVKFYRKVRKIEKELDVEETIKKYGI